MIRVPVTRVSRWRDCNADTDYCTVYSVEQDVLVLATSALDRSPYRTVHTEHGLALPLGRAACTMLPWPVATIACTRSWTWYQRQWQSVGLGSCAPHSALGTDSARSDE